MLKKLRIKLVCINMTIITIMLVLILCMVIHFTKDSMEQANIQMMQDIAENPLNLSEPGKNSNILLPYFTLNLDRNGNLLETNSPFYNLSDRTYIEKLTNLSSTFSENTGVLKDYQLRFMNIPTPTGHFLIFMDISTEISTLNTLTRNCILIGIFSFFVFLGISIFFANWAVKPVDEAWTHQKQFIADASHELKTPLTVILTNTELLKSDEYNTSQKARFSDNIMVMAKQMQGLVEGLLELSRIDNDSIKTYMKTLDFSSLTASVIYLFEPLYFESGLELISDIDSNININGSENHLKQVIEILLDNASKYSVSPSQVHVKLHKQHTYCILSVSSCGEHIAEEDLKNIFNRFYRIDKSRNRTGSYGLGLSIAKSILTKHHGKIWAESNGENNIFFVRLPCIP